MPGQQDQEKSNHITKEIQEVIYLNQLEKDNLMLIESEILQVQQYRLHSLIPKKQWINER